MLRTLAVSLETFFRQNLRDSLALSRLKRLTTP